MLFLSVESNPHMQLDTILSCTTVVLSEGTKRWLLEAISRKGAPRMSRSKAVHVREMVKELSPMETAY
jgi:hypothetical protein